MGGCISVDYHDCPTCKQPIANSNSKNHVCEPKYPRKRSFNFESQNNNEAKKAEEQRRIMSKVKPLFPPPPNNFEPNLYKGKAKEFPNQFMDIKVPTNRQHTQFKWVRFSSIYYPPTIVNFPPNIMRFRSFQQKMLWFRLKMEKLRVSWEKGCQTIIIDRRNIVNSSLIKLEKINLRKQLKIQFDDEVVDDAGGLLREWMHLTLKEIFSPATGLFVSCKTQQTAYKLEWDKDIVMEYAAPFIKTLGIIIGKALFERVSINCFLCRTLWRQIAGQPIIITDMHSFDEDMYKSWNEILNMSGVENLFLTMSEIKTWGDKTTTEIELVPNGKKIEVTDANKLVYIAQLIDLYSTKSILQMLQELLKGVHCVIPQECLSIFQPHQYQMMLNGPQFIDIADWKNNTVYKNCSATTQIIKWFWEIVESYNQKKLATLLHYCTGTTRVPILGFKYLESNRNCVAKFQIETVEYNKGNPYPQSYTCFNRILLPIYQSKKDLQQKLGIILEKEINSFGLG